MPREAPAESASTGFDGMNLGARDGADIAVSQLICAVLQRSRSADRPRRKAGAELGYTARGGRRR
jgi:hypothetical protein